MIGAALPIVFGLVAHVPPSDGLRAALHAGGGWGHEFGGEACLALGADCASAYGRGPALEIGASLFWGSWLAVGARSDLVWVPGSDRAFASSALALVRVGRALFVEAAIGAGYAWAQRPSDPGSGKRTSDNLGLAGSLELGVELTNELAIVTRAFVIGGVPGLMLGTAGIEYRL
jgi:hypothetical protein